MHKHGAIRKRPVNAAQTGRATPVGVPRTTRPVRVLISAGPTYEPIDAVRFIGNRSSGAMGIAIADEAAARGAECTLLLGPTSLSTTSTTVNVKRFRTTADLQALLAEEFPHCDVLIMAAAVADYRVRLPRSRRTAKISRNKKGLTLRLEATPDLVAQVARLRRPSQVIVGFALEPRHSMRSRAAAKLARKGLDLIVANPLETMESGSIQATVLSSEGTVLEQRTPVSKAAFARKLIGLLLKRSRAATLT
ncbi:MAG TPA: phosphopantothenoylcysteine decarboxylase [Phycisphaerales bacterium]|nr:phosphopantothenoylcysteine decarboxylase [Phycisphaerales bacterium]